VCRKPLAVALPVRSAPAQLKRGLHQSGAASQQNQLAAFGEELGACQRVAYIDTFSARLIDVKVSRQHRLHIFEHGVEVFAID